MIREIRRVSKETWKDIFHKYWDLQIYLQLLATVFSFPKPADSLIYHALHFIIRLETFG